MKMNRTYAFMLGICSFATWILTGCSGPGIHGEKTVLEASSSSVPSWVKDSSKHDQKELIHHFEDQSNQPNFYYLVSQAHVDHDSLIPSCYNFARANAANELASAVSQEVKGAVSSASDSSSDSQYAVSTVQTKSALSGAQIQARYWEQTQDKNHSEEVTCYIVTAIPLTNFNALKKTAILRASKSKMDQSTQEKAEKASEE